MSSLIVTKSADIKNRLILGFSSLKHLKHIHAALLRLGLDEDTYLLNRVLRFSFNFGNTRYSYRLLYQTKEPNNFLFNTMIRGLVLNDCFQESIEVYHSMRKEGLYPDSFTFPFVLKACARVLDSDLGFKMHSLVVKAGCEADVFVNISLVNLYAKCGFIDNAFKVFDDIPEKNFASWTATISGYVGVGRCREAIDIFRRLLEKGLRPDSFSLVEVLSACKRTGDLRSGEWIDEYIKEIGMVRNVFVATALVDFYVKCGNMVRARSVFDGMLEKNIVSWSSMIQGYASNGLPKEALDLFFKMLNEGLKPDCYAMVGVLCSCARLGALELGDWASNMINGNEFLGNACTGAFTGNIDDHILSEAGSISVTSRLYQLVYLKPAAAAKPSIRGFQDPKNQFEGCYRLGKSKCSSPGLSISVWTSTNMIFNFEIGLMSQLIIQSKTRASKSAQPPGPPPLIALTSLPHPIKQTVLRKSWKLFNPSLKPHVQKNMGNYASCCVVFTCSRAAPKTAKLMDSQGKLRQVSLPVKAAELMLEEPGHAICPLHELKQRNRLIAIPADDELLPGKVYLLVTLSKVNCKVSASELAIMESTIAACAKKSSKKRNGAKVLPDMAVELEEGSKGEVSVFEGNDLPSSTGCRLVNYRQWTPALEPISEEF
ncbi:hypothetical protein SADUNF_Sadunf16G0110400 [Salix dunnii]|uniref:Pentatricopeptide repeat-containing protein n=1 Tax=Salix dunnii TaxID=1413687 RepID=A0A835JB14_9ROSI|nr:hypothetical protein SADUNF_Sadunf16G0110400 [Salix dunnii]